MGNDADRYRRYLDGDDNGLIEIIEIYHEGLTLYLNSIVNNICLAEELMQDTFLRLAVKKPRSMEGNISKRGCIALQSIVQSTICEKTLKYHIFQ